jgi:hypothetical protein
VRHSSVHLLCLFSKMMLLMLMMMFVHLIVDLISILILTFFGCSTCAAFCLGCLLKKQKTAMRQSLP